MGGNNNYRQLVVFRISGHLRSHLSSHFHFHKRHHVLCRISGHCMYHLSSYFHFHKCTMYFVAFLVIVCLIIQCDEYSDIRIYLSIFRYEYSFVSYLYHFFDTNIFGYSFVCIFLIRIYSYIRSYHFFYTNIFGYSFVWSLIFEYTCHHFFDYYNHNQKS